MSEDPQPKPTAASDPQARLRAAVAAFPAPGFAVIDGAHFDDVPALFRRDRLFARSLYLDTADPEIQAAGPWLVALDQAPDATETVFTLVGDKPAAVFWCCSGGERVLWRHLRTLNMALIPQWAADGGSRPREADEDHVSAKVFFRHADPSVLATMMPVMTLVQFARFFGPARELAFVSSGHGFRSARCPTDTAASAGLISFTTAQMSELSLRRTRAQQLRIADYLRSVVPEKTSMMSDEALLAYVRDVEPSGRVLGLRGERALGTWSYLMLASNGEMARSREVRLFLTSAPGRPDDQVDTLIRHMPVDAGRNAQSSTP